MGNNIRDRIAWVIIILGVIGLAVWYLLKVFGIMNSPLWFEILPLFSGIAIIATFAYFVGTMKNTLDITCKNVIKNSVGISKMHERLCEVERVQKLCVEGKLKGSPY